MKQLLIGFVLGLATAALAWSYSGGEAHGQVKHSRAIVREAAPVRTATSSAHSASARDGVAGSGACACPGDLNGDLIVNGFDLVDLLSNWGPCQPIPPDCCESICDCSVNEDCCGGTCLEVGGSCIAGGVGVCDFGTVQCVNEQLTCVGQSPQPETCNGLDDDCDGVIDNGNLCGPGEACCFGQCADVTSDPNNCGGCNLVCPQNTFCSNGSCVSCPQGQSLCGGVCAPLGQYGCGTGACAANYQCVNGQVVCTPGSPSQETCNGIDDDCDGIVDNGDLCGPGQICINGQCVAVQCTDVTQCDDGNMCTVDQCINFQCVHTPLTGNACDDGNPCTINDTCDGNGNCVGQPNPSCCQTAAECDDGDQCTIDTCVSGTCQHSPAANGTACDDGDPCTVSDVCNNGTCIGQPLDCTPYICSNGCLSSCTSSSQCVPGYYCSGNTCVAQLPLCSFCAGHEQCQSGFCVNGFCEPTAGGGNCP